MTDECVLPGMLQVEDAIQNMIEAANEQAINHKIESLLLREALHRVTAEDILSDIDVPPHNNAAMDGYALKAVDLEQRETLLLVGTAYAGKPYPNTLESGHCIRIMTGAEIPKGADTVIMQEQTSKISDDHVLFSVKKNKGNNVRKQGESVAKGSIVIKRGTRLSPGNLALLASLGESYVSVFEKIKVGILATGDELVEPGKNLQKGQIFESNSLAIQLLLQQYEVDVFDYGIIPDQPSSVRDAIQKADAECDIVISSGGVSVGDADFVKDILDELGEVGFWKVAMKPGKPFAFGRLSNSWFCGLPGNPVSAYVTCEKLVFPFLRALQHEIPLDPSNLIGPSFDAIASVDIKKAPGRKDFQRGIYFRMDDGTLTVQPKGPQGSGIMSSIAGANCYIVLEPQCSGVVKGETVKIQPFGLN